MADNEDGETNEDITKSEISSCFMHFDGVVESLSKVSLKRIKKFITCRSKWAELQCQQGEIARQSFNLFSDECVKNSYIEEHQNNFDLKWFHHAKCYKKFCDEELIRRQHSKQKTQEQESCCSTQTEKEVETRARKLTRLSLLSPASGESNKARDAKRVRQPLVTCETVNAGLLRDAAEQKNDEKIEENMTMRETEMTDDSDDSDANVDNDDRGNGAASTTGFFVNELQTLYNAALIIRKKLKDSPKLYLPWPPLASDITFDNAKKVVPSELFNMLSWICGFSEEAVLSNYVPIKKKQSTKIMSIAQDLILPNLTQHYFLSEKLAAEFPTAKYCLLVDSDDFGKLWKDLFIFANSQASKYPTFALWMTYIEMVQILLLFLRATRSNDWDLHLSAVRSMLPWFFVTDRVHYSTYGTAYWLEMSCIEQTNPGALSGIITNWTCQRQQMYGFSSVACDQVMEQTYNRDSKVRGGLVGFTLNRAAVHRWIMAQGERGAMKRQCLAMAGLASDGRSRKDLDKTQAKYHENEVNSVLEIISSMTNPFGIQEESMLNIASGVVAAPAICKDMLSAKEIGETKCKAFINDQLLTESPDLFAPIKAAKLKTFSTINTVSKVLTSKGQETNKSAKSHHRNQVQLLKEKLWEYGTDPFAAGPARELPTRKEIDP
eukprot:gene13136-14488_t